MWILKVVILLVAVAVNGISGRHLVDSPKSDLRIIGGREVDITQFPHQVSLQLYNNPHCGGSIISEQFVLTAAHCMGSPPSSYTVRAGSTNVLQGSYVYDVASTTSHPQYNLGAQYDYDIAVVKTAGSIRIDGVTTRIVRLAPPGSTVSPGTQLTVTGWGNTNGEGSPSTVLKAAMLSVMGPEQCRQVWSGVTITDRMLCAGGSPSGPASCQGDSGGPLVDGNFVQYGVVSFGVVGCIGKPSVFASVANLRSWIQQTTGV